jgi:hypothetical protein
MPGLAEADPMCIKAGADELDSVKAVMMMSLNAVVADTFQLDLDELDPTLNLYTDLKMDAQKTRELDATIREYFDGLVIDFSQLSTVGDLFDRVIGEQFEEFSDRESAQVGV